METVTALVKSHAHFGKEKCIFLPLKVYKEFEWIFIDASKLHRTDKAPLKFQKFGTDLLWAMCELLKDSSSTCGGDALDLFKLVLSLTPSVKVINDDGLNAIQICRKYNQRLLLEIFDFHLPRCPLDFLSKRFADKPLAYFFVKYGLRRAYSHMTEEEFQAEMLATLLTREEASEGIKKVYSQIFSLHKKNELKHSILENDPCWNLSECKCE